MAIPAERQGFSDQIGAALAQGVVEPFDMRGFAGRFRTNPMPLPRQNQAIALPSIRDTERAFAIVRRQRSPERAARDFGAIPTRESDDVARLSL